MKKRILGINDDRDFCQCCGKTGLRRVVWIENLETGTIRHFGTTCAGKNAPALFGEIKEAVKEHNKELSAAVEQELAKRRRARTDAFLARKNELYTKAGGTWYEFTFFSGEKGDLPSDGELMERCWEQANAEIYAVTEAPRQLELFAN